MDLALDRKLCEALGKNNARRYLPDTSHPPFSCRGSDGRCLCLQRDHFRSSKIFQDDFIALEQFRSTYSGTPPAPFKVAVKQIVLPRSDKGPEVIDRCTSCHVALEIPQYSPTKVSYDLNGNVQVDAEGNPIKILNEEYIWKKLDERIELLSKSKDKSDLTEAESLKALKTATIDGQSVSVEKCLQMHPLMGRETRPFEYHPMEQYGCTSCHNGNGRGLVIDKAHGPVYDGDYTPEFEGEVKHFLENDPENDPSFARAYNGKPNYELLFQTTPLFVGGVIEAKCVQCHQPTSNAIQGLFNQVSTLSGRKDQQVAAIEQGMSDDLKAVQELLQLKKAIAAQGLPSTLAALDKQAADYTLAPDELKEAQAQAAFVRAYSGAASPTALLAQIDQQLKALVGSQQTAEALVASIGSKEATTQKILAFYKEHPEAASGSLFAKAALLNLQQELIQHVNLPKTLSRIALTMLRPFRRSRQMWMPSPKPTTKAKGSLFRKPAGPAIASPDSAAVASDPS